MAGGVSAAAVAGWFNWIGQLPANVVTQAGAVAAVLGIAPAVKARIEEAQKDRRNKGDHKS